MNKLKSCFWQLLIILPSLLLAQQQVRPETVTHPTLHCASDEMMQSRPNLLLKQMELEDILLAKKGKANSEKAENLPYVLPIVVHIIHNNGAENISDAQVMTAIEHLNQAFAHEGYYAQQGDGTNTQIQFCLARRTPDGQLTNGITRTVSTLTELVKETQDQALKDLVRWDPTQYLNVWVVKAINSQSSGPGVAGYAYLASAHGQPYDGMVCEAQFFGASAAEDAVFIHEIGHYLNLYHTFEGGCPNDDCTTAGDRVCDTPPDQATHTNCVYNSCGTDADDASANNPFSTDVDDATENFMDYSPFGCYRNFTEGQAERMRMSIEGFRSSLLESEGCKDPCTSPVAAAFLPSATDVQAGDLVNFTNQTTNAQSYEWYVNGNLEGTGTDFSFQFLGTGNFVVELRAYNADPNCLGIAQASIHVSCGVSASFTVNATELEVGETLVCTNTSTGATGYGWFINGVSVGTGVDLNYVFSNAGFYTVVLQANSSYCMKSVSSFISVSPQDCQKYVQGGTLQLTNTISTDFLLYSDMTPNGNLYLESYLPPNAGMISKLDANKNTLWHKKIQTGQQGIRRIIAMDDDGAFVHFKENSSLEQVFFATDANGNTTWAKKALFNNNDSEILKFENGIAFFDYNNLTKKFITIGMSTNGTILWNRIYSLDYGVFIHSAHRTEDGQGFWLVGTGGEMFENSAIIMKVDITGNLLYIKKYVGGPIGQYFLIDVDATSDDGFVASGYYNSTSPDFFIMKGSSNGNIEWAKVFYSSESPTIFESGLHCISKPDSNGYMAFLQKTGGSLSYWLSLTNSGELEFARSYKREISNGVYTHIYTLLHKWNNKLFASWLTGNINNTYIEYEPYSGPKMDCITSDDYSLTTYEIELFPTEITFTLTPATTLFQNIALIELPVDHTIISLPYCSENAPCPESCTNALDDDEDGYVDCFDADCQCFDGADCQPSTSATTPVTARLAWQSPVNLPGINNTPVIANLDPQNGDIPEIIVAEGISDNLNQTTVGKLLIYQGDGSNAANPDVLNIPQLMSERSTAQCVGDVNSDGTPELAVVCWDKRIRVYTNFTPGNSQPMTLLATSDLQTEWFAGHLGMADFDGDGTSEIYSGNEVFQFDFSNPNTPQLKKKLVGSQHAGFNGIANTSSIAVDLLSVSDCNGDPDCAGLELVAGAYIYSVDLDPFDGDGVEIKVARNLNALEPTGNFKDGYNNLADLDLDGTLDIVTVGRHGTNSSAGFYVWNKNGLLASFTNPDFNPIVDKQFFTVSIANVFDDKTAGFQQDFPEIIFPSNTKLTSFNLQKAASSPATPYWWSVNTQDASSAAGPSCFDFNGDGYDEVAYRDERYFRILYGGPLPLPAGVDADRNWVKMACNSQTLDESPVVADMDADGETEVVTVGYLSPYVFGQPDYRGRLYVFKSDGLPWTPARAVWNQFNYIGVNINDDLSIPKQQQLHHLEIPGLGSGKRPLNSSRAQWPIFDENFDPNMPVPDALVTVDSTACEGDSLRLWLRLCNHGSNLLPADLPIAFYQNDPRQTGAVLKSVLLAQMAIPVDSCFSFSVKMGAVFNAPVFVVANDDGSQPLPYATADFPVTNVQECDFENNFDGFVFNHQNIDLDLGPDRSICASSIIELNAGAGFQRYRWQDGTTDSTFTAFGPGTYWVDAVDGCGNLQSDTVIISLNQIASIELGPDQTICDGESLGLHVAGFADVQWSPATGLSCADCPSPTAAPAAPITYYVTAANGNCFASDSIRIFVQQSPSLTLMAQDGDCTTIPQISATVGGTQPVSLVWSTGATGTSITPASSGSYSVTATSTNGCESVASITVTINNSLVLGLQTTPLSCIGGLGSASVVANGGTAPYTYLWSNGADTPSATVAAAGPISVTVTDASGCISAAAADVGVAGNLTLGITITPITCHGSSDGTATVQPINGTAPFQWLWADGQTTTTVTNLASGSYNVTVTDANGCSGDLNFSIAAPAALSLSISATDVSCFGEMDGTATVTVSGGTPGYEYFWSNVQTAATATQLSPDWHTVTVTDENGCTETASVFVSEPTLLTVAVQADAPIICPDSTTNIAAIPIGGTPAYTFLWPGGQTDSLLTNVGAGDYPVTVTDENGCTANASVAIQSQQLAVLVQDSAVAASSPTAPDGSVFVEFSGGQPPFTYLWSNGDTNQNLLSVPAGDYVLTLSDALGCGQSFPFTVDFLNAASQKLDKAWAASILPNPAAGGGVAQLAIQSNQTQSIDYQLFELTGKLLWEQRIQVSAGYALHPVTTPTTAGVYMVALSNEQDIVCLKWVVMD